MWADDTLNARDSSGRLDMVAISREIYGNTISLEEEEDVFAAVDHTVSANDFFAAVDNTVSAKDFFATVDHTVSANDFFATADNTVSAKDFFATVEEEE